MIMQVVDVVDILYEVPSIIHLIIVPLFLEWQLQSFFLRCGFFKLPHLRLFR